MKQVIVLAVLIMFVSAALGQQARSISTKTSADYLTKSKKQKKTARILLAGGSGLIIASLVIPRGALVYDGICVGQYCSDEYKNDNLKTVLFITGAVSDLASIPFFISSKRNKKKATMSSVLLRMETTPVLTASGISSQHFPVVGINIQL